MDKPFAQFECVTAQPENKDELLQIYRLIFGTPGKINGISMKESHCIMKKFESGSVNYKRIRKKNDILEHLENNWSYKNFDLYIGQNTYINGARIFDSNTVFSCKNICIDIDNHNADPEEIFHAVNAFLLDLQAERRKHKIPMPNTIVYTGRGMQIWYHLISASAQLQPIVSKTAEALCKKYEDFIKSSPLAYADLEVDIAASTRRCGLSRLPGSYNTKAMCFTQGIILSTRRWDINELKDRAGVQDKLPKKKRQKTKNSGQANSRSKFAALLFRVLREAAESGDYSSREVLCHIYHSMLLAYGIEQEPAELYLQEFNQFFSEPLPAKEIDSLVKCDNHHHYRYSEAKLFAKIGISQARSEAYFREKQCLYKRRDYKLENADRDQKRLCERIKWQNEIRKLWLQGYSINAISKMTGRCRQTVKKYMDTPMEDAGQAIEDTACATSNVTRKKNKPATTSELDLKRRAVQLYKRGFRSTTKIARIMEITEDEADKLLAEYKQYRKNKNDINTLNYYIWKMGNIIKHYLQEGYKKLAAMDRSGIKGVARANVCNLVKDLYDINVQKKDYIHQLCGINPKSEEQMTDLPAMRAKFYSLRKRFSYWQINWNCKFLDEAI